MQIMHNVREEDVALPYLCSLPLIALGQAEAFFSEKGKTLRHLCSGIVDKGCACMNTVP